MRTFLLFLTLAFAFLSGKCQLLDNYDTCRTQTYYQYIGSPLKETHIEKARTVQDNGIINAGYVKQAAGQDALIIKQNAQGQVMWQKEYGNAAYDERITDWRELTNRQLLIGGIATNRATQQSNFFMMQLAADGTLIWQRTYADVAPSSNIINAKIYPDAAYGEYFFAVEGNSFIIYGMTNNTGTINWQRNITTNSGTKLVGVTTRTGSLLIATNTIDSGYKVANFYYINYYTTGNPKNVRSTIKLGGAHQNSNYILHDFEHYIQYTYFSGIRSVNGAPYELIRVNINQGVIRESLETIVTPGIVIDSSTRSAINIYGDAISFTAGRKSDWLHTIKMTESYNYPVYVIWSSSYHLPDSVVLGGNIKTWDAGYLYFGFKELQGGNKKIIQLKIDSASNAASCISKQRQNFTLIRNPFPVDTVRYTQNNVHTLSNFDYTALAGSGIIDTLTLCRELQCPSIPLSNNCLNSFQKLYQSYNPGDAPGGIQVINGRTFMVGVNTPMDYTPEQGSAFLAEMNSNGQVIHQKKYVIGIRTFLPGLYKGKDSSLLICGITFDSAYYPSVLLAKMDTSLNVTWIKSLRVTTTPQYGTDLFVNDVKQGSDGSYFILYSDGNSFIGLNRIFLTKLNSSGGFLWSKVYKPTYPGYADNIQVRRLEVGGGNVYMMAVNGYNDYTASILLKATESNGNLLWCKKYDNGYQHLDLSQLLHFYTNELYMAGGIKNSNAGRQENILLKANTDGNIVSAASLKIQGTNVAPEMEFLHHSDGNIYMTSSYYNYPPYSIAPQINATVNSNFNIITSKQRTGNDARGRKYLAVGMGQQLYEIGGFVTGNYSGNLYFIKFAPDGSVGTCLSDTMPLEKVTPAAIAVTNINCSQSDSIFVIRTPVYRIEQSFLATSRLMCASVPGCNSIHIVGDSFICNKTLYYTFRAVRNAGCVAPVQWIYNNSNIQVINETDSSITLRFLASGSLLLKARLTSNCTPYTDSLLIHISSGNVPVLNLGADTTLCSGATLLLRAKKGFRTYLWQDGSTDSVFTVTAAGLYYVTVTDSCNNIYKDSIRVQITSNGPVLNLGPDRLFCNSTPIVFNAHAGFLSYLWQNGSTDSVFTATAPGLYHVRVTDVCNNIFRDTVKVNSYRRASSLNLGNDTVFCNAVTLQLRAGAGFKNYKWQDASTDSVFMASNTGLYYVEVTDSCGAIFTDSIRISPDNIFPFVIGSDTSICKGDSILLTVTPGLSNYVWSPLANTISQGAAAITAFPNNSTMYYVSAVKPNGCPVKDSIRVSILATPVINLGFDSRLCAGDTLLLNAGPGFNSYTWSTGEHTASIKAYQAGQYYVSATNNNNCKARDTLSILAIVPLPVTQLPAETAICKGHPTTLHAGTGFTSYLWNTGALTESITVTSIGQYRVTVTNSFGCKKTDTLRIARELALPADFIPYKDSTICIYEGITLTSSQNYTSYLWSNASTNKSITVNNAGKYSLKVTDANGCTGIDSVTLLQKDCNLGLFFPNSFTPNNDGLNDTYKPKLYGRLNTYHLIIYNRYGQILFESRNVAEGWTGMFKGVAQETGGYIWQCWYQFTGEKIQNKSGPILLIR